jgi:hypothetical protein
MFSASDRAMPELGLQDEPRLTGSVVHDSSSGLLSSIGRWIVEINLVGFL